VLHVPLLSPPGRHRRRADPAARGSTTTAQAPAGARLDTRSSHYITGVVNGTSTFINNWAAIAVVQVAISAAQGSTGFVVLAMALESVAVVALMVFMSATRRNVAAPGARAIATWLAAAGMLAPALWPNRITLLVGFLSLAWMSESMYTLRTVISDAKGDRAAAGQQRVQAWIYRSQLALQLGYVAIASATGSWRYANSVIAGLLAVEGVYLLVSAEMRRADPRTIHQPGADQPLLAILRYRPVFWAVLSVTASYVVSGLFFARAQTVLTGLGWSATAASWIVVGVAATRALTLRLRPTRGADGDLAEREQHHGRALIFSAVLMGLSAAALGVTLLPVGAVTATVGLVGSGVLCQYAMNRSNPIVRAYVAQRSVDASTWLNLGGMAGVALGGVLPVFTPWPWLVGIAAAVAAVMIGIAVATLGHRYETDAWRPLVPGTDVYEFAAVWTGQHLRFTIRPGGRAPLPDGFEPVPPYTGGLGVDVVLKAPINPLMERQYWPSKRVFRIRWQPLTLERWLQRRQRRTPGRARAAVSATRPALELITHPADCLWHDTASGTWYLDLMSVVAREGVVTRGVGPAPYHASGRVWADITYEGVRSWEVIEEFVLPEGTRTQLVLAEAERWVKLTPGGRDLIYEEPTVTWPSGRRSGGGQRSTRWVVPAPAVALATTLFTRVRGEFEPGTLVATPFHY
jgi:hypothetical protein